MNDEDIIFSGTDSNISDDEDPFCFGTTYIGDSEDNLLSEEDTISSKDSDYDNLYSSTEENLNNDDIIYKKPMYVADWLEMCNLSHEFGSGVFLIDGDSLLLSAICDANLSKTNGGQILHCVYLVERQLQTFIRRRGKFHIVFFKDSLFVNEPQNQLLREVLIFHLKEELNVTILDQFQNAWDTSFEAWVQNIIPIFFLMFDVFKNCQYQTLFMQMEKIFSLQINVAFINDIVVGMSSLKGYHIFAENSMKSKAREVMVKNIYHAFYEKQLKLQDMLQVDVLEFNDIQSEFVAAYLFIEQHLLSQKYVDFAKLVVLYVLVKKSLPLQKRALPKVKHNVDFESLITEFQQILSKVVHQRRVAGVLKKNEIVCDIWDGNLFATFCNIYCKQLNQVEVLFDTDIFINYKNIIDKFDKKCGGRLKSTLPCDFEIKHSCERNNESFSASDNNLLSLLLSLEIISTPVSGGFLIQVIPVDCKLVTLYAGNIYNQMEILDKDDPFLSELLPNFDEFEDIYHWHCKILIDEYEMLSVQEKKKMELMKKKTSTEKKRVTKQSKLRMKIKEQRRVQRVHSKYFMYLQMYGESLGINESILIVLEDKNKNSMLKQQHRHSNTKGVVGKAQLIIEQNKLRKLEEQKKKDSDQWKKVTDQIQSYDYSEALKFIQENEKCFCTDQFKIKLEVKKLSILRKLLHNKDSNHINHQDSNHINHTINLFLIISKLFSKYWDILSLSEKRAVAKALHEAGFFNLLKLLNLESPKRPSKAESQCHIEFQLKYLGHFLSRTERNDPDPRISNFIPDTWQRKLFDAVDNNKSALIIAPTSSGKTYASYYCMERILRSSNDDVVVYVSPTKALVNQVHAFVNSIFTKNDLPAGKTICGVFTRDYKHNVENCQILVTVPQCLEILLLSIQTYAWSQKIKYVIFDEVHCIGADANAETWEHLLCIISCPFLALSATVANPEVLHSWLQDIQNFQKENKIMIGSERDSLSYQVELVIVKNRYSDLENYVFIPEISKDYQVLGNLQSIHPICTLKLSAVIAEGIPEHISLSPRECLKLYDAMKKIKPEFINSSPTDFFIDKKFLTRDEVRLYENELKKEYLSWSAKREHFEGVQRVLFESETNSKSTKIYKKILSLNMDDYLIRTFMSLIKTLEKNPCYVIVFCLDRLLCHSLVKTVVAYCERKEKINIRKKNEKKLTSYEKSVMKKSKDKANEKIAPKKKEISDYKLDNDFVVLAQFAGKGLFMKEDLTYLYKRVAMDAPEEFMKGIRYGVAMHHAGMNNKLRTTVEILFRKKFLNIVIATSTLALGIHVPCKTVVIAGDSVYLDPLMFRQMSGRAGRRGFDMVGNVVFHGFTEAKVSNLVAGNLPEILGNFPMTVSLCLRMCMCVNGQVDKKANENTLIRMLALLKYPLLLKEYPELDSQFKHFFLFSVQFLIREGLLKSDGTPQGLAGLASHLYYHEPRNFVFVSLLNSGVFHQFCNNATRLKKGLYTAQFMEDLIAVLSYFFTNTEVHPALEKKKRSTSVLILKKLPDVFVSGIQKYNERVKKVYNMYLSSISNYINETFGEDVILPLSHVKFTSLCNSRVPEENTIESMIWKSSFNNKCCSNFVGTSSHSDANVYTPYDRISKVRNQVYTDVHEIPLMKNGFENKNYKLNSYALDFYKHGNVKAIREENGLKCGEEFGKIKDFMLTLKSIACSFDLYAPKDDSVRRAFRQVADEFEKNVKSAFGLFSF
ncbi:LOW QUALITY PROTEIN: probable ATP-dependent RNA helicase DDX60 isoform X3 [Hydra vulgaris]|uniref:LOW QUALITY PROTEIN: probable ATP-dependent RNA helicase DDX60 isoform X3 n=1 Tax=Hydra vulgaris TaxID=6087 RepID=A0ABM4CKS7_HYDVU